MSILSWDKPAKARSHDDHVANTSADGAPPGCYVPNMSREDAMKWKAKVVGAKVGFPQVEIRRDGVVIVLSLRGYKYKQYDLRLSEENIKKWKSYGWYSKSEEPTLVHIATSGPMQFTMQELNEFQQAIAEGIEHLKALEDK